MSFKVSYEDVLHQEFANVLKRYMITVKSVVY